MNKPTLLVVDDDADTADMLGTLLELYFPNASVVVAHGGQAAVDLASRQRPVAAVLDLEMPGMNGETLARALRQKFIGRPLLLIALSGNVLRLSQIRADGVFDHYLSKPTHIDSVVRLLEEPLMA